MAPLAAVSEDPRVEVFCYRWDMGTKLFEPGEGDVLYLVDLSGYVFRAYHAIGALSSAAGEPTNAVYGTVTMLEKLVRERQPQLFAVAMDSRKASFRREIYSDYKANRDAPPEDLTRQFPRVAEVVSAFGIPIFQQEGMEADDVIATTIRIAREHQLRTVIVSADKDLTQLVGNDVLMWDTMRDRVVGPPEVRDRYGVTPEQMRDLLALMGDTSDNVPGVPSIGPKTARDLLVEYGSLDGVFANLEGIARKKLRETLIAHRDQAYLSRDLVTLRTDCRVTLDLEHLRFGGRDLPRLRALYAELGFHRLIAGLGTTGDGTPTQPSATGASRAVAVSAPIHVTTVRDVAGLQQLAAAMKRAPRVALAAEGRHPGHFGQPLSGLAISLESAGAFYVPVADPQALAAPGLPPAALQEALGPELVASKSYRVAHDSKRLRLLLREARLELGRIGHDPQLASYLLDPEARHGLDALCERELGIVPTTYDDVTRLQRGKRLAFDAVPIDEAANYLGTHAALSLRLQERLEQRIADERLASLLTDVELPLSEVLADMELTGVLVDSTLLATLGQEVERELVRLEGAVQRIAGTDFNVNSPRQLEKILFDDLHLKPLKRTKTARSTDAATLEALADQHELPRVVLEHRQLAKLKGTYIDALPSLVSPRTGRIHTSWGQAVAATGRLSSADPNLQNIPIRTALGRRIREAFVAPPGHQLLSADYSQIELRVLAHLAQDEVLLDAFRTGQDVHLRTAMEVFEVPAEAVTPEMRRRAKAVNFGIIYGQGDSGLAKSLGIPRAEASSFIAAYYRRYDGVRHFMDQTLAGARAGQAVQSLLGRRRLLPDIDSANRAKRLAAERIAMNMPIQGTAADLQKLAMLALAKPVTPGTRMVLTVHDELVFEVPNDEVEEASHRIRAAMESVWELAVPLVVDVGTGSNWNAAH